MSEHLVAFDKNYITKNVSDVSESIHILNDTYFDEFEKIALFLFTLVRSANMSDVDFQKFRKKALKFVIENNQLFRRAQKNMSLRRVIDSSRLQQEIMKNIHEKNDHREREETYEIISARY